VAPGRRDSERSPILDGTGWESETVSVWVGKFSRRIDRMLFQSCKQRNMQDAVKAY
jgi:hypothetical protein